MKHERKPSEATTYKAVDAPHSPFAPTLIIQSNEPTCAVNVISTPITDTECLSENHELELDDFTQLIAASWDEDMIDAEEKKSIPALNRMKSLRSSAFLKPKQNNGPVSTSNDGKKKEKNANELEHGMDTSLSLDNISIHFSDPCSAADHSIKEEYSTGPESIEIPYDDFVPAVSGESNVYTLETEEHNDFAGERAPGEVEEPKAKNHIEFRRVKVSIKIKALNGITRIYSRKKINFLSASSDKLVSDGINSVGAVVSYQDKILEDDEHLTMHSISLPLTCEKDKKLIHKMAYAMCREEEAGGSHLGESESEPASGISFRRTLTRPLIVYNDVAGKTVSNLEGVSEYHRVKDREFFVPSGSKSFASDMVTLQVGLERCPDEAISLGVATVIIPWEYQTVEMNIPVMKLGNNAAMTKKKLFALGSSTCVSFPGDSLTKYKIEEGANLSIRLVISPGEVISDNSLKASQAGQIKADTQLSKKDETDPKKNNEHMLKCSSLSSESFSKTLDALHGINDSVANLNHITLSTPISLGGSDHETKNDGNESPAYPLDTTLSIVRKSSSVPLFKLHVPSEMEDELDLSEISDSDSSSRSIVRSRHSALSSNHRKGLSMTEKVIKFLTCHPTSYFERNDTDEGKGEESSDMSSSFVSSSSGSTSLSSSLYEDWDVKFDANANLSTYKLPD